MCHAGGLNLNIKPRAKEYLQPRSRFVKDTKEFNHRYMHYFCKEDLSQLFQTERFFFFFYIPGTR